MEVFLFVGLVIAVVFGGLGGWIAGQKYRSGIEGFWLGFVFGPLGCLIEALLPSQPRPTLGRTGRPGSVPKAKPRRSSSLGQEWVPDYPEEERREDTDAIEADILGVLRQVKEKGKG